MSEHETDANGRVIALLDDEGARVEKVWTIDVPTRDEVKRVTMATTDELATRERSRGKLVIDPQFIAALASIHRVFAGARVVDVRMPRKLEVAR